jgi:hypothetical protein
MPRIIRAEFLSYYNARRNSDKLFNVFVIEDDDGTFRAVSEYGRRGNNLVRDTLCTRATRDFAESKLRQKLTAKRNHRETPYADEPFGYNYSGLAREYGYSTRTENAALNSNQTAQPTAMTKSAPATKANVIAFPAATKETPRSKPKLTGIINQEQFDSLEI